MAREISIKDTLIKYYQNAAYFSAAPSRDYDSAALDRFKEATMSLAQIWKETHDPMLAPLADALKGLSAEEFRSPMNIVQALTPLATEQNIRTLREGPAVNPFA